MSERFTNICPTVPCHWSNKETATVYDRNTKTKIASILSHPYRTRGEAKKLAKRICVILNAADAPERVGNPDMLGNAAKVVVSKMETSTGNAAAMREALKKIGAMEIPHNFQIERSDIVDACYDLTKAIKIANAALSDPPRNCDRFRTWEEAGKAWEEEGLHLPLIKWLFGTAKKGGAK